MGKRTRKPVTKGVVKVPTVMQMETLECGAASLAMVMAYYGTWVALTKLRSDMGVSRDGVRASHITKTARSYGFEVKGMRYEPDELRREGEFPCIIHWEMNHFVVLRGFKGSYVYLSDPARGDIKVSMEEFDRSFTGVCILIRPGADHAPSGKRRSVVSFIAGRLRGAKKAVLFVGITMLIGYAFELINPSFSRYFVDILLTGENVDSLIPFLVILSVVGSLQILISVIQALYSLKIDGKMSVIGNSGFMWKLLRSPVEFFSQRLKGDLLMRQQDNAMISSTVVNKLAPIILNAFMMVFYLVVMIRYSPLLSLIGVASVSINLFLARVISKKRVHITGVMMRDEGRLESATISGISMMETIKSSGAERGFFEKWSGYQALVQKQRVRYTEVNVFLGIIPEIILELTSDMIIVIGVFLAIEYDFSLGMIMAFQTILGGFMSPAESVIETGQVLQEMRTRMERVEDVMEYPDDDIFKRTTEDVQEYGKLNGDIELRNVTFGYSQMTDPILKDFSMHIKPGSKVAIVGGSGSGKSTVSKLISGLYKPWSGDIYFGGKPISEIDRRIFTGSVAVVDQDITLFSDTIDDNIKMWDDTIENYEVILAARDAQIHDDIMARVGGYHGRLLEEGRDLSGGQRQRLEVARVLAQDPSIIILDEATSALDAKTEYEMVKAIENRGITCIVIAHRLSTIRDCDEIFVLEGGQIVEHGKHEELYAAGGVYAELIASD